jgi:hypothetical protein
MRLELCRKNFPHSCTQKAFLQCDGVSKYLSSYGWLLPLSIMASRLIPVVTYDRTSFFSKAE